MSSAIVYALFAIVFSIQRNTAQRVLDRNILAIVAGVCMLMALVALHRSL